MAELFKRTQYVACKFRENDRRTYTYHNDGEPVKPGDRVRVTDRSGDGWQAIWVDSVSFTPPAFDTKPILGLHVEPAVEAAPAPPAEQQPGQPAAARGNPFDHRDVPHTFMFEE